MQQALLDKLDPQIMGRRLQAARRACGLTQGAAALELGVARTTLTALEKGQRRVRSAELTALARIYGRDLNDLISSHPVLGDFTAQFRSSLNRAWQDQSQLEQAAFELQKLCEDYLSLEAICQSHLVRNYPPEYSWDGLDVEQLGEDIAASERHRLGLGEGPISNLRESLENDLGIRIFYLQLPLNVTGMYTYSEDIGACFGINSAHPAERRRWSIAREYARFLTYRFQSEIAGLQDYQRIPASERLADCFAGAFLMPAAGLRHRYTDLSRAHQGRIAPADLCRLASYYFVSVNALTLRLEALRLVPVGSWESLQKLSFVAGEPSASQFPAVTDQTLPLRYQYLAVEAFQKGDLSEEQLMAFLRLRRLAARRTVRRLSSQTHVLKDGQVVTFDVNFSKMA